MNLLILASVLCAVIFIEAHKQKDSCSIAVSIIIYLYFIASAMQSNPHFVSFSSVLTWAQYILLLALAAYLIYRLLKSIDRKKHLPAAVFAVAACVFRVFRTYYSNRYTEILKTSESYSHENLQKYLASYGLADLAAKIMLVLLMVSIARQLKKTKANNS